MSVRADVGNARVYRKKPDGPLTDEEIVSYLRKKIDEALNHDDGEVSEVRERMLHLYEGRPVGDETGESSRYRDRTIFEAVENWIPDAVGPLLSDDMPFYFEPETAEDIDEAREASSVVNYYVFRRNNAYGALTGFLKSVAIDPNAYLKVHAVKDEKTLHHKFDSISPTMVTELTAPTRQWKEGVVVEQNDDGTFSFEGTEIVEHPEIYIDQVPGEQMLIDRNAQSLDMDEVWQRAGFICHRTEEVFTDLVARGYDPEELDYIGDDNFSVRNNDERVSRQNREDELPNRQMTSDYSMRRFTVYECYVRMDCDGTGKADTWRIVMVGDRIMEKERVSYQPFVAGSYHPMPHKHIGMSLAESLEELQLLLTKLWRIALDDAYRNELRKFFVWRGLLMNETMDQFENAESQMVVTKDPPGNGGIMPEPQFSVLQETMALLQQAQDAVKLRSGMSPANALNPDVLRDATAHGLLASAEQSSKRVMHAIRTLCETTFTQVGIKVYQLLRMHADRPMVMRLKGKFTSYDPTDWRDRTSMTVQVGLGFNSPQQSLGLLAQLLQLQEKGVEKGLAQPKHIKHTLERMVHLGNLGSYGEYFDDPERPGWKPPPPAPDPQMEAIKAQGKMTEEQEKTKRLEVQAKARTDAKKLQIEEQKVGVDEGRIRADAQLKLVEAERQKVFHVERAQAEVKEIEARYANLMADLKKKEAEIDLLRAQAEATRREPEPTSSSSGEK